jgi:hypothetical protein
MVFIPENGSWWSGGWKDESQQSRFEAARSPFAGEYTGQTEGATAIREIKGFAESGIS